MASSKYIDQEVTVVNKIKAIVLGQPPLSSIDTFIGKNDEKGTCRNLQVNS